MATCHPPKRSGSNLATHITRQHPKPQISRHGLWESSISMDMDAIEARPRNLKAIAPRILENRDGITSQLPPVAPPLKKRTRTSKPKVRTGCNTCKIRRVKCDEARPICKRCARADIVCDGYGDRSLSAQDRTTGIRFRSEPGGTSVASCPALHPVPPLRRGDSAPTRFPTLTSSAMHSSRISQGTAAPISGLGWCSAKP